MKQPIDEPLGTDSAVNDASAERQNSSLGLPVSFQGIVFAIIILATLYVARGFLLPVVAALLLSYTFVPIVRILQKAKIPRIVASFLVVMGFAVAAATSVTLLSGPAIELLEKAPKSFGKLEKAMEAIKRPVENVNEASEQLGKITGGDGGGREVVVRMRESSLVEVILNQTPILIGGILSMLILLFFLLAFGDVLLRRVVEASKRLEDKKRAVEVARQVEQSVSSYLITVSLINACLGITLSLTLWTLGAENPILWGFIACAFNFIPYLGAVAGVGLLALASLSTVDPLSQAMIYPACYLALTTIEGNFITPMILGRSFTINPIFIILVLLFLGWLWGIPGAIMAVPLLIGVKRAAEQFDSTRHLANLIAR